MADRREAPPDLRERLTAALAVEIAFIEQGCGLENVVLPTLVDRLADAALAVLAPALAEARAEIEDWRGRLATQCGHTLAMRERCAQVAAELFPRGSAHTYASENADVYRAQEATCAEIAKRIRALRDPGDPQ